MSLIIKNGLVVTASDKIKADVKIEGEIIKEIGINLEVKDSDQVIDAEGKYIMPGGIDSHVHFGHPDYTDNFQDGSIAAAMGGVTTVLSYIEPPINNMNLVENFDYWNEKAEKAYIDYCLQPIVTEEHLDDFLENVDKLKEKGVVSIKLFMSARSIGLLVSDSSLYKILKKVAEKKMIVTVHCENGDVIDQIIADNISKGNTSTLYHGLSRPTYLEAEATDRILAIAEATGAKVRVAHISCKSASDELAKYKSKHLNVYGETCAHYLTKDITDLDKDFSHSARYICAPPLREKWNQEALWDALINGTITSMGSDHAPVAYENMPVCKVNGKERFDRIPNGGPGVEDMLPVVYHEGVAEGRITVEKFVAITSTNIAKEMGLYPRKGTIAAGSDADIIILDPDKERVITVDKQFGKCDYNPYEGKNVKGAITHVLSRGEIIAENGEFKGKENRGKYIERNDLNYDFAK